ncbi:hypothetical protein RRG08_043127 [Elysia crispata]|uniref:Uncharacterized protein n=1 Tax=Elysia crispata TaxID=231223 RepID=A0AAE0XYF3_9GAST|nr:hypothetical protein RRG08_043127 [Elysia crispata]
MNFPLIVTEADKECFSCSSTPKSQINLYVVSGKIPAQRFDSVKSQKFTLRTSRCIRQYPRPRTLFRTLETKARGVTKIVTTRQERPKKR